MEIPVAAEERYVSGVALVTGGARAIGFEVGRQLAQRGVTVILGARDPDRASAAAGELAGDGLDVRLGTIDVTDGESVAVLALVSHQQTEIGRQPLPVTRRNLTPET